jgi:hypothetical protein
MTKYVMNKQFVRVLADVYCDWEGLNPIYRVYVNNELFAERTFIWPESYLEEMLQIEAPAGKYHLRWELVPPHLAQLTIKNVRVDYGSGNIKNNELLRIYDES